jgi:hypothetical protein
VKPFILHADAEVELREALDFYEGRRTNLGREFRQEFEAALPRVRGGKAVRNLFHHCRSEKVPAPFPPFARC